MIEMKQNQIIKIGTIIIAIMFFEGLAMKYFNINDYLIEPQLIMIEIVTLFLGSFLFNAEPKTTKVN